MKSKTRPGPKIEVLGAPVERLVYELRFAGNSRGRTVRNEVAFEDPGNGRTKLTITVRIEP